MSVTPSEKPLVIRIDLSKISKRKRSDSPSGSNSENGGQVMNGYKVDQSLKVERNYCNFCGDHFDELMRPCQDCGAYMCEQSDHEGPGCIAAGTLKEGQPFYCIVCEPRRWRREKNASKGKNACIPYTFTGYGGRKRAKLAWPMVLATLRLSTLDDSYLQQAISLDIRFQYVAEAQNLCLISNDMKYGAEKKTLKKMRDGVKFIQRSIYSHVPANTFIVIDTHSDTPTGGLAWGENRGRTTYGLASELLKCFCGDDLLGAMKNAADKARQAAPTESQKDWYDCSPYTKGGWRGLLLSVCSPTMTVEASFNDLTQLVRNDVLDFVLGFAGSSTLPAHVRNAIGQAIERIGVDKTADIWDTVVRVIGHDLQLLEVNTAILVFKERGKSGVLTRRIARHSPPLRPWGVEFSACGTPGCDRNRLDFFVQNDGLDVRMTCRFCGWKSAWVKERHWREYVYQLDRTLPNVFWHQYPPPEKLANLFVDVTKAFEVQT